MCKKGKKNKVSKYAQIIDASFKNTHSLIQNVEWYKKTAAEVEEETQSQIQELKKELDDLRTKQMFEGLPTKEQGEDLFMKNEEERMVKQLEVRYATILPMIETFMDRVLLKVSAFDREMKSNPV